MKALYPYLNDATRFLKRYGFFALALVVTACQKTVNIKIPAQSQQLVVDGSIENGVPPVVLLSTSQQFFTTVNLNDLGAYFVHGAKVKVTGSDGSQVQLEEICLGNLGLPAAQEQQVLSALGYSNVDSANLLNICAYTVPDIVTYYLTGTCSYIGHEHVTYTLDIMAPPLNSSQHDSIHATGITSIPTAVGIDSLVVRPDPDVSYNDSFAAVYAYITVPDTFGNFIRYLTKEDSGAFYPPMGGSVYDDRLFVGRSLSLPLERGTSPSSTFDVYTDTYFPRGDTATIKWSSIDAGTYRFFYTMENDGGGSPFSSPVKIIGNVNNALGCWAGYGTKYYSIYVPKH